MKVRTRFAPSPTGTPESIHLGFIIRALWSYAYAIKNNGQYILRIEDTDQKRSRQDTEQKIYDVLHDFGINHHEGPDVGGNYGPYRQSERLDLYQEYAHKLVELGAAYYDFDAEKREKEDIKSQYDDKEALESLKERPEARDMDPAEAKKRVDAGESYVVRVKMPENQLFKFDDWILGKTVKIHSKEIPDLILLKSDGFPTYHLAVVVDDHLMEISHVFRGMEWISTTPIHLYIYDSLGWDRPEIGHFPVIIDPRTNKKFSKRDMTGMFGVHSWLSQGYLKEALLNYLMLLGWAPKDNRELFTLDEFVDAFDQDGIQKSDPTFDPKKLEWFQGQYIRGLELTELYARIHDWYNEYSENKSYDHLFVDDNQDKVNEALALLQERTVTLADFVNELDIFFSPPTEYQDYTEIKGLKDKQTSQILEALNDLKTVVEISDEEKWVQAVRELATKYEWKDGDMFMLLRLAVWGKQYSPPLFETLQIIGSVEASSRIDALISSLS